MLNMRLDLFTDLTRNAVHQSAMLLNIIFSSSDTSKSESAFKLRNAQFGFCDLWQPIIKRRTMCWNSKYRCGVILDYNTNYLVKKNNVWKFSFSHFLLCFFSHDLIISVRDVFWLSSLDWKVSSPLFSFENSVYCSKN